MADAWRSLAAAILAGADSLEQAHREGDTSR
jgi:hypothetical protein